jgi:hypothetical protein
LLETVLKSATVFSLLLVCWVFSLWSHPDRICWKDPKLAAMHLEAEDGYRKPVPRCSPLSYLMQYDFSEAEREKIERSLKVFSKVQSLAKTLNVPNQQRFHLVVSRAAEDHLATRLFATILSRGTALKGNRLQTIAGFYGEMVESSDGPQLGQQDFALKLLAAWGSKDTSRVKSLVLGLLQEKLKPLNRPEVLLKLWHQKQVSRELSSKDPAVPQSMQIKALVRSSVEVVRNSAVDSEVIEDLEVQQHKVKETVESLLRLPKVVQVKTEDSDLVKIIENTLRSQRPQVTLLDTGDAKLIYPSGSVFESEIDQLETAALILLQCEAPSLLQTNDENFDRVYFVKTCPGQDVDFVAEKLISYLKASPGSQPRIESKTYSLIQ